MTNLWTRWRKTAGRCGAGMKFCPPQSEFLGGRFKNLSENFYRFVCSFETLHDAADAVWFVSARDYASPSSDEAEFRYEDFEKDSLECAVNDA